MVVSRSDAKRRQKDGEGGLPESPKRTKVHAQRKFAQGSNLNTPTLTPVKEKDKGKVNGTVVPTELLPAKRPNTEDFLTFLCFRGTEKLPSRLDFFNVATAPEQQDDESKAEHSVAGTSRVSARCIEKSFPEQSIAVAKAETKTRNKLRPTSAVQAFKKKYQEQHLAKQKNSLTKLAQKVKGKNMVRTRSAALLEENRRTTKTVPHTAFKITTPIKVKAIQKPVVKTSIKRLMPKLVRNSLRRGLRSGGELPPGSDVGLKSERKPRLIAKEEEEQKSKQKSTKRFKMQVNKAIASSLSDFSSDDDQPLIKKQRTNLRHQRCQSNPSITTRSSQLGKLRKKRNVIANASLTSRPTRKTKEAAALFMEEMIGKDLRSPDDSDDNDEVLSDNSFTESVRKENEKKEVKNNVKASPKVDSKRESSNLGIIPTKKKKEEDKKLLKKTVVKLNMIKEKDTKSIEKISPDKGAADKKSTILKTAKEDKVELQSKLKNETKAKPLSKKSDRRHSLPEASKVILKRTTRQRPGNLSLDSSPIRSKTFAKEIDDKFNDSDEEPLKNISSKKSTLSKQIKKSPPEKKLVPVVQKESMAAVKISARNNEMKKLEAAKKGSEKQNRNDDVKSKFPKKEALRKSHLEVDVEEKQQPGSRSHIRSRFRNTKSAEDIDSEVKGVNTSKRNNKSINVETKVQTTKKIGTVSNKSENTKVIHEISTGIFEKPKLKKGWVFCDDDQDLNGNSSQSKNSKTLSVVEDVTETVSKKEIDQIPEVTERGAKTEPIIETKSKKSSKKNNTNSSVNCLLSESTLSDNSNRILDVKPLECNSNKHSKEASKSNASTLVSEDTNKNITEKSNSKVSTNSNNNFVKEPNEKNIKKNNFQSSKLSNSLSDNTKEINNSVKKSIKNKTLVSDSEQDDTKKTKKIIDSEIISDADKLLSKQNVNSNNSKVIEIAVSGSSTSHEISENVTYNNKQDSSSVLNKSITQIDHSQRKKHLDIEMDEVNSAKCLSDLKNKNITKKSDETDILSNQNTSSQRPKTSKNKKGGLNTDDKTETSNMSTKANKETKDVIHLALETSNSDNILLKDNIRNICSAKVPDSDRIDGKYNANAPCTTETLQLPSVKDVSKTSLESDKNKNLININENSYTPVIEKSCSKTIELDSESNKNQNNKTGCEEVVKTTVKNIENIQNCSVGVTRLNISSQKTLNNDNMIGNSVSNNNIETVSTKESQDSIKKLFTSPPFNREQTSVSAKHKTPFLNKNVESSNLQSPHMMKSNIDFKVRDKIEHQKVPQSFEQPASTTDANYLQPYQATVDRTQQQKRGVGQKLDQLNPNSNFKSDQLPNEKYLIKEVISHNVDTKTEHIDTKGKIFNLGNVRNIQKVDEKLKNESIFGNTKEIKNNVKCESKVKVDAPLPGFQLLKSNAKTKSMLKPGTLIDIAGGMNVGLQSDSLTSFMRPPLDNAMTIAIKTDSLPSDNSSVQSPAPVTAKIDVKAVNKLVKDDVPASSDVAVVSKKEKLETTIPASSMYKSFVNDTWRQAFKNVKLPKPGASNTSSNSDKPVVRKPFSVTTLAKKHTLTKSDSPDKLVSQPSIPFLRQSKPFLGGNQAQINNPVSSADSTKTNVSGEIDMDTLRKKEAEVEEIVRHYYAKEFLKFSADVGNNSVSNESPNIQTETNVSNINTPHQREDYLSKHRIQNMTDRLQINTLPNASQSKEDSHRRNEMSRTSSPLMQQIRDGTDILETNSALNSTSTQPKEEIHSPISSSLFSNKDRTPSPSRSFIGNVDEHSFRHISVSNPPIFNRSVCSNTSLSEAKHHHLPLPVEQTLKKLSLSKTPTNKKTVVVGNSLTKSQDVKDSISLIEKSVETVQHLRKSESEPSVKYEDQTTMALDFNKGNSHFVNKDSSPLNMDLMAKKKVNMTTEEIKKWLSDSTSVGIEHKQNCGIFDKNHCECGYKTIPSTLNAENIQENQTHTSNRDEINFEKNIDAEHINVVFNSEPQTSVNKMTHSEIMPISNSLTPLIKATEIIEGHNESSICTPNIICGYKAENQDPVPVGNNFKENSSADSANEVYLKNNITDCVNSAPLLSNKPEDLNVAIETNTSGQINASESASNLSLINDQKTLINKKVKDCENKKPDLKLKNKPLKSLKIEMSGKNKRVLDGGMLEPNTDTPTSPTPTKPKLGKQGNRPGDSEAELSSRDPSEVSSPPPRDDVSSSNDDSPDKFAHPERRSIFHQRRSLMKMKEKKESLLSPSSSAFSPDNESSVYAFDPDPPPTSSTPPFRRCKKDGRTSSTATDDDESTPSSASIAVQVNLDNEAVLECSTQTEMQEVDDDDGSDGHLFYIPLQQSHSEVATAQQLIQGVAVKLGTEGPDQRVIMRAKLVTKPPSTFSRQPSSTAARALMPNQISRSGKPEQKVRPLSIKSPPVGTVTPTTRAGPSRSNVQPAVSIQTSPKHDHFIMDEKNNTPGPSKETTVEPETKITVTKSPDRTVHNVGKTTKRGKGRQSHIAAASVCSEFPAASDPAKLVEAPTFYPNDKEFQDPLEYIDSIRPLAEKFGLCRVVPPSDFKPECKVSDDMRFTAYNQYIHKMLHRWGPNVKEMMAIRKYLATQSIALTNPPWVGGMEVDLPRLYQTVQVCGGLKEVIEKKRWNKVADTMKIPKSAQDRVTKLDDIYCKFLLPYDTLSHEERTKLFKDVENEQIEREKRVNNATDDDSDESDTDDIDECIVKGRSMALNAFYRIARNTMSMWFSKTEQPSANEVETEFWRHVNSRQCHVCVHSGSIDSGSVGYGFPVAKNSSTSRHPWNLKVLTNNPGSILRSLGPLMGVTVPTLHVGMLFSACCWYRDPHGLPWIEYLHTGASKIWYGIPDSSSSVFRDAATNLVPRLCRDKTIWLASDTAMVPPPLLVERGVSLCRVVQEPGQFIIVFPKAFTSSICTGYLVSESVYFAHPSWLGSAQQIFDDIRESCEPCMFSLEKLLFSIAIDTRTSVDVLNQILPMMLNIQDEEIARRKQLEELGLSNSERLPVNKRRKSRPTNDEEVDYECDICRANLFLSLVTNTNEEAVYCLSHAIELLSKKRSQFKHCNFLYTYSEDELNEVVDKLKSRIETKSQKKLQGKNTQASKN